MFVICLFHDFAQLQFERKHTMKITRKISHHEMQTGIALRHCFEALLCYSLSFILGILQCFLFATFLSTFRRKNSLEPVEQPATVTFSSFTQALLSLGGCY